MQIIIFIWQIPINPHVSSPQCLKRSVGSPPLGLKMEYTLYSLPFSTRDFYQRFQSLANPCHVLPSLANMGVSNGDTQNSWLMENPSING